MVIRETIVAISGAVLVAIAAGVAGAVCWFEYDSDSCDWVVQQNHDPTCGVDPNVFWSSPVTMVFEADAGNAMARSVDEEYFCAVVIAKRNEYGGCMSITINTTDTISQEAYGPPCIAPRPQ